MEQALAAREAAARLGVKLPTLYAYVSRGLIRRDVAPDGRTSLFDPEELDAFRATRRRTGEGELDTVISTGLTRVGDADLRIRGRDLTQMIDADLAYEEVVDWLWDGGGEPWDLPADTASAVDLAQGALPPTTSLTDRLRVTVAVVSATDPLRLDSSPTGMRAAGRVLLRAMVAGLPLVGRPTSARGLAGDLWPRLTRRRATAVRRRALNAALGLLVDHGLAASTLAARVAASVRADPYSVVTTGLGVLGGRMHGAASADVHRLLVQAHEADDPAQAVGQAQQRTGGMPGFGHKVYRTRDPRHRTLMAKVDDGWQDDARLETVHGVGDLISRRSEAIPNADFALGALTWLAEMTPDAGQAIFAVSRTAGWLAHALEEYTEPPLRFRPQARYTGPQ